MTEFIDWLRVQLDEDERLAREAADAGDAWRYSDNGIYPSDVSNHPGPVVVGPFGYLEEQYGEHIARHDPARVLAEVDAKRRIVAHIGTVILSPWPITLPDGYAEDLTRILRLLALPYADRTGYREEWRP